MKKQIITTSQEQTIAVGKRLGEQAFDGAIITLNGDLGVGKTTITKGIALGLGVAQTITSPTFTIMKQYQGRLRLTHIDAYRLYGIGFDGDIEEAIYQPGVAVIEWSDQIAQSIEHALAVVMHRVGDHCTIEMTYDQAYASMVEGL
jgi:tRNA threonylcarbamoyladenosine biosynthesis protein TsaE